MIDIIVCRGAGDIQGDDITDTLITNQTVAVKRGTTEIDKNTGVRSVNMQAVHRVGVKTGHLVQVLDALQGESWKGKITSLDNAMQGVAVVTNMRIERLT